LQAITEDEARERYEEFLAVFERLLKTVFRASEWPSDICRAVGPHPGTQPQIIASV